MGMCGGFKQNKPDVFNLQLRRKKVLKSQIQTHKL